MKLTSVILLLACLHVHTRSFGQGITLTLDKQPVEKFFDAVASAAGTHFLYSPAEIEGCNPVSIDVHNVSLQEVLTAGLKGQPVDFTIRHQTVIIKRKKRAGKNIQGIVTAGGKPLAGVSVMVKGSPTGTTTDTDGHYLLQGVVTVSVLEFSSVGYERKEIVWRDQEVIDVSMSAIANSLDETVIVGYGTTTKRLNTGHVGTLKGSDIEKQPVNNPLQALEGRISGLFITQQTGAPGGAIEVRIRGLNSIQSGNDPLYIVDGVPFTSAPIAGNSTSGLITRMGNPLSNINPYDIASIEVLKDADATAIYGSRGANGVILITTKNHKAENNRFELNIFRGWGTVARKVDLLNRRQYLDMRDEAFRNDAATPTPYDYDLTAWDTTRYTDWQKELIGGTADVLNVQGSYSGGNKQTNFLLSTGYSSESTVFPGDFKDRKGSVHVNVNHESSDGKLRMHLLSSYSHDQNNLLNTDLTFQALTLAPVAPPLFDGDGKLNWANTTWPQGNPLSYLLQTYQAQTDNLISNLSLEYEPVKNLILKTSLGYTNTLIDEISTSPAGSYDPAYGITSGSSIFGNNHIVSWIIEPQVSYSIQQGKWHAALLAGMTFQQQTAKAQSLLATGFIHDGLLENIQAAADLAPITASDILYKYNAVFGRLNLDRDHKYLLNITGRRDGSSRFGPGKQFANFGAIGAGWIFSEEPFIQHALPFLSLGKLRGSYGTSGNDQTLDYGFLDLYNPVSYPYQGSAGLFPDRLFNRNYSWEINKKVEGGIELGFVNNKVFISASYFRNRSSHQLVGLPLSPVTGFNSIAFNLPATVQNTGFEFELNSTNIESKHFRWSAGFNLTLPKNVLLAYPGLEKTSFANTYTVGQSLFATKKLQYAGVDPQTGLYTFMDLDKDGTVAVPADTKSNKSLSQTLYGGLQNTFRYKSFSLDIFIQFVKQTGGLYSAGYLLPPGFAINQPTTVINRWQQPGDQATVQQFTQQFGAGYFAYSNSKYNSDHAIGDASYVRLKNVMLSYSVNSNYLKKHGVDKVQLYLKGQNLATLTSYQGADPENQSITYLPPLKMICAGVQLSF